MALWILRLTSSRGRTIVAQDDKVSGNRAPTFLPDPLRGAGRSLCLESASQGVVMPEIVQSARSIGPSQKYRPPVPPIDLPDRQWPSRTITRPPVWCAVVFFFSIETLATVGYGEMYPATAYGRVGAASE